MENASDAHVQEFRRSILTALAVSILGGIFLALSLGVASGRLFVSVLDFLQQAAFLAILFFAFFAGAALGTRVRDLLKRPQQRLRDVAIAVASVAGFLAFLYTLGFVDFGMFSYADNRNSFFFAAVGAIGASTGFFRGNN